MTQTERDRIPIFLDADLKADIKRKHAATKGFSFQAVGESLIEKWARAGMPFPIPVDLIEAAPDAELTPQDVLFEWVRTCHKNPADYLAAEFACRRALGIKPEDWEEFQKGLRK